MIESSCQSIIVLLYTRVSKKGISLVHWLWINIIVARKLLRHFRKSWNVSGVCGQIMNMSSMYLIHILDLCLVVDKTFSLGSA